MDLITAIVSVIDVIEELAPSVRLNRRKHRNLSFRLRCLVNPLYTLLPNQSNQTVSVSSKETSLRSLLQLVQEVCNFMREYDEILDDGQTSPHRGEEIKLTGFNREFDEFDARLSGIINGLQLEAKVDQNVAREMMLACRVDLDRIMFEMAEQRSILELMNSKLSNIESALSVGSSVAGKINITSVKLEGRPKPSSPIGRQVSFLLSSSESKPSNPSIMIGSSSESKMPSKLIPQPISIPPFSEVPPTSAQSPKPAIEEKSAITPVVAASPTPLLLHPSSSAASSPVSRQIVRAKSNKSLQEHKEDKERMEDSRWRLRPCRNEYDCRRTIIEILKQTRGATLWNAGFNWNEDLHLSQWDGKKNETSKRVVVNDKGMIKILFLDDLDLEGQLPEMIGNLTSLVQFSCRNNQLTLLPESLGSLLCLVDFDCAYNKLRSIPDSIGNLVSLQRFFVGNNRLLQLPEAVYSLQSVRLFLSGNPITSTETQRSALNRKFDGSSVILCL